jgi:primosomal protein N' (replication factor Y)
VDEEHDGSYKQRDSAPRFHARDAAIFLAGLFNARVLLGSATPSLESLYNVQTGKYGYVPLKERYMGVNMPTIEIAGFAIPDHAKKTASRILTARLIEEMEWALKHDKQIILFQNKRGYSPFQMCTSCGWVPQCKNCAVSLTYHKSTDKLHCHYCGARSAVIQACPACGHNQLASRSFGTEKIEEEVQSVFPKARVARMDVDSMRRKNSMVELLDQLEKQKIDILVGTQMVVKGLDLANVALVGILSADSLLSFPDFRVNERAFQLMEQVSGRAGRIDGAGRVVIQAFNMQHPVLKWVMDHDVQAFYRTEIKFREHFGYPPFTRIIKVILRHESEARTIDAATVMAQELVKFAAQFRIQGDPDAVPPIHVQGPGPAIVAKVRNQFIQEIWLKCNRDMPLINQMKAFLKSQKQQILALKGNGNVQIVFDVDPV